MYFDITKSIVQNGENTGYLQFSQFPEMFTKKFPPLGHKDVGMFFEMTKNIVQDGENAGYLPFSQFPEMF